MTGEQVKRRCDKATDNQNKQDMSECGFNYY